MSKAELITSQSGDKVEYFNGYRDRGKGRMCKGREKGGEECTKGGEKRRKEWMQEDGCTEVGEGRHAHTQRKGRDLQGRGEKKLSEIEINRFDLPFT